MSSRRGVISLDQANKIADGIPPVLVEDVAQGKVAAISVSKKEGEEEFDASKKPPFSLGQIRAAIPKHCWERSVARSFSYVARDVAVVIALAYVAAVADSWLLWPLYWLAQGTMFWAIFVLGHDCGHGSFSASKTLNNVVGHVMHSFILVPYHGWRISHRTHHANHGHVENDESWYPMTASLYKTLDYWGRLGRLQLPVPLFAYPIYLWTRSPGKNGSHFNPKSDLFEDSEWKEVTTSTACWLVMAAILCFGVSEVGFMWMLKLYFVPYIVNVMWLDAVTYLHHHGYEKKVPWYRGQEWSYMRGGLSTIDRDYGFFNKIHHDIGTHVVHHLFPQIPHYHLCEATAAVKPLLGNYYREPEKSGPLPLHLVPVIVKSFNEDHFVADEGDIVFYQKDLKSE
ncbi:hypothetical protein KC19_1G062200 [Ceratodon purpureus]|uniref:Omega-3 fatty acid desaturase n=1 Tax=Ceratodon purpureus TaxID=3225 RepID=A0A8T0J5C4_CERPU|nr:hypothetical protein KC19_1G062200 [Ceratodon purpureus]